MPTIFRCGQKQVTYLAKYRLFSAVTGLLQGTKAEHHIFPFKTKSDLHCASKKHNILLGSRSNVLRESWRKTGN